MAPDLTLVAEPKSPRGFRFVHAAIDQNDAPVEVRVEGRQPGGEYVFLVDATLGGNRDHSNLKGDLYVGVTRISDDELWRYGDLRVFASGPVELTYTERTA